MPFVYFAIVVLIIYFIYVAIHKKVVKATALKPTDLDTDLREFRESHAVSEVINGGQLNLTESVVQKYERMCVVEPFKHRGDPSIPGLIKDYNDIISGKVLDQDGSNVPSEFLLGRKNPDYQTYLTNQARALKKISMVETSNALRTEKKRVLHRDAEDRARNMFYAQLVEQGVPLLLVSAALTDEKLNTYTENDWRTFCRVVKEYLEMSDRAIVTDFVSTFDDQKIVFDLNKFESFAVFHQFHIPKDILVELVRERVSADQAIKIVNLHDVYEYDWSDAMEEVLQEDLKKSSEEDLRKQYGWKG